MEVAKVRPRSVTIAGRMAIGQGAVVLVAGVLIVAVGALYRPTYISNLGGVMVLIAFLGAVITVVGGGMIFAATRVLALRNWARVLLVIVEGLIILNSGFGVVFALISLVLSIPTIARSPLSFVFSLAQLLIQLAWLSAAAAIIYGLFRRDANLAFAGVPPGGQGPPPAHMLPPPGPPVQ
ncbi:MAG: hypothetical protein QOE92_612 [Chloroflexota bacterium]|jgi:hypothetical protein|nr:hypothetical protein [Chloroflexota bacterium]